MNDDHLAALKAEHRELDEQIRLIIAHSVCDQLELARLKRCKLRLKDQIQLIGNSNIPDSIA